MKKVIKESELRQIVAERITTAMRNQQVEECREEIEHITEGLYGDYGPEVLAAALRKYADELSLSL